MALFEVLIEIEDDTPDREVWLRVHADLVHVSKQLAELGELMTTAQDDINANTAELKRQTAILTDVKTAVDAIKAANPAVDLTPLDAAVAGEGAAVAALQADVAPPAPPAAAPAAADVPVATDVPPEVPPTA